MKNILVCLVFVAASFARAEDTKSEIYKFDVRIAPLSMFYTGWYNVETAYRLKDHLDIGLNYTRFGREVENGGNMFFPTYEGNSYGLNANYYFLKPSNTKTYYGSLKLNYEDFESIGHASTTVLRYRGPRVTLVGGIRANLFSSDRFHLLLGGGAMAVFYKTDERTKGTSLVTNSYQTNSLLPFFEFKIGYSF